MSDTRQHAHQLIDRMPETQLSGLVQFLESIVDPAAAALRNAAFDDEPETDDEKSPSRKPGLGYSRAAERAFLTPKPCANSGWSRWKLNGLRRPSKTWPLSIKA